MNRYLKWALVEAGNLIVMQQQRPGDIRSCEDSWSSNLFRPAVGGLVHIRGRDDTTVATEPVVFGADGEDLSGVEASWQ